MDGHDLAALAEAYGTPLHVYSEGAIRAGYAAIRDAFAPAAPIIAYAVKANANIAVLAALVSEGAHFDIVSLGELERVLAAGAPASRVIFSGVGKRTEELRAALALGVLQINVESVEEGHRLARLAEGAPRDVAIALRLNPDVDPKTHRFIATGTKANKFGMTESEVLALARDLAHHPRLRILGLHVHVGSQITDPGVHPAAAAVAKRVAARLLELGVRLQTINLGGGFGIAYRPGDRPLPLRRVAPPLMRLARDLGARLILEPGRSIVAPAGVLLTRVEYLKRRGRRTFVIVDAAMTELIRPALYEAHHEIVPVARPRRTRIACDVVGPVCESGDFLAKGRELPEPAPGDLLAVLDTGAYGASMSSNYNARPHAAEVLLSGGEAHVVRWRQRIEDLWRDESIPPHLASGRRTDA